MDRKQLETDLSNLKQVKRKEVAAAIHQAIRQGDLSAGSVYDRLKTEQESIEAQIRSLELQLDDGAQKQEIELDAGAGVLKGSQVRMLDLDSNQQVDYQLVSPADVNLFAGKISWASPIGKMLLGRKEGSEVEIRFPLGKLRFKIIQIK